MSAETKTIVPGETAFVSTGRRIRVAVVCDFLEELWPSMDLVAEMLCQNLARCGGDIEVTQLRPGLRERFTHVPLLPAKLSRNADRWINRFAYYPAWLRERRGDFDLFHIVDHSY